MYWNQEKTEWALGPLSVVSEIRSEPYVAYKEISYKIQRVGSTISGFSWDTGTSQWNVFSATTAAPLPSYSAVYVSLEGGETNGFQEFNFSADGGLPYSHGGGITSAYYVSAYYYSSSFDYEVDTIISYTKDKQYTSAYANIIGSTIYVLNTSAITDNFVSALYSATSANGYNLFLIDSVLSNFISSAGQFSACSATIRNSTFNINGSSATYIVIVNENSQYNWIQPTPINYPFHRSNVMYGKDINYILVNKKMLRPFNGITVPSNPGYGYPTYPNYETGLFGYSRKDYLRND